MTRVRTTPVADRAPIARTDPPHLLPTALAVAMATAYMEVRTGRRPSRQLDPYLEPAVARALGALVRRTRGRRSPAGGISVRRVRTCEVNDDVVEATVVVQDATLVSAVAVRLERRRDGRWRVAALAAPEDRPPRR